MSATFPGVNPNQPADADFAGEYEVLLKQTALTFPQAAIGFEELKATVRNVVEAEDAIEGCSEMLGFDDFETFFGWFDALSAYDQMDEDFKVSVFKPLLDVIYRALVAEYKGQISGQ